jgi:hypothetical protein
MRQNGEMNPLHLIGCALMLEGPELAQINDTSDIESLNITL